eukprot:m.50304 g.50304  ORF g.50304 m.50304 type:complete len:140 (+) comp34064_c0_seq10:1862-2281(+)
MPHPREKSLILYANYIHSLTEIILQTLLYKNGQETSQSLAVRMALGETEVIQETKDFLQSHGIELNAFEGTVKERSKTVILVKNLPFETMESDLRSMFSPFGDLGRVVCPPAGVTGIVEFTEAKMAKRAFTKLAYAKVR